MSPSILLSQFFLPLQAVSLGRFVISLDDPHQDFHDPPGPERVQTQYDSIASQLTGFLSSSFSKRLKASIRITADQSKTYYLNNAGQCFRDAVKSQATRKWIERTIDEGEAIYVLGGQSAVGGTLAVLVSTALTASGVVDPGRIEDEQQQFIAPAEQIYAVQYRKVCWKWFSSNKVDEITLAKKAWWKPYDGVRNLKGEPEDMIEVELEDEIALEGDHDECTTESGEAFISIA
ncbi:MAG: hypothetical protein M1840_008870 [Geoglossum simile]|nr:MAG: hypothetical protein M1840_008870 [Geoglossum simile]